MESENGKQAVQAVTGPGAWEIEVSHEEGLDIEQLRRLVKEHGLKLAQGMTTTFVVWGPVEKVNDFEHDLLEAEAFTGDLTYYDEALPHSEEDFVWLPGFGE